MLHLLGKWKIVLTSSRADDVEERMSSEDPDNLYDGIRNIESNGLDLESSYDDIESKGRAL